MSELSLEFTKNEYGKTYLDKQYASYPFHICRTQYFENDPFGMANIYIQSASGGIYENESLVTNITANTSSYSHITTQASTIVHGMENGKADQAININAINNAYTEYISDPLILFPGSNLNSSINVYIDQTSTAIVVDSFLLHFLNTSDVFSYKLKSTSNIFTDNNELLAKDVYITNPQNFLKNNKNYIGMGNIFLIDRSIKNKNILESLQAEMQINNNVYAGATLLPNDCGILFKFLAPDGDTLKKTILKTWISIRESLVGIKPNIRRK